MTKKGNVKQVKKQEKPEIKKPESNRNFWLITICILLVFTAIIGHVINRPFYGLHSWAQASGAWAARAHVKYGLHYTKGVSTLAVGMPPKPDKPLRYMDHPELNVLVAAGFMKMFGINEWGLRVMDIISALPALLLFILIVRDISNSTIALISGAIYVLFPLTSYFSMGGWPVLFGYLAMWMYLIAAGFTPRKPKKFHYAILAFAIFMAIQFSWVGFFFAMGIGVHYVLTCLFRRKMPNWPLLIILAGAPALSMLVNFAVMASGYNWDINKIITLFKWRSAKGEMEGVMEGGFDWGAWFARLWLHASTNFTVTGLIIAIIYLTIGQLLISTMPKDKTGKRRLAYPCFLLFFLVPFFQLFILKGCLWPHQTWETPLAPFLAIAIAMAIVSIGEILKLLANKNFAIAIQLILAAALAISCFFGTKYYYDIRWQPEAKIEMFKKLNKEIPPDKALLSYEDFIVNQNEAKGAFIRPEIAWYLDRDIVPAQEYEQVKKLAATGQYPVYMCPAVGELKDLIEKLMQEYPYEIVKGVNGEQTSDGKFLKAGMYPYVIFNLTGKK